MGLPSPDEPVFRLHRRRLIDSRPVLVEINTLLASWCPDLLDARLDCALTPVLRQRFGKVQTRCTLNYAEDGLLMEFDQEFWLDAVSVAVRRISPPGLYS